VPFVFQAGSLASASDLVRPAGPAQSHGPSWTQPKTNSKNLFKKFVVFSYIFYCILIDIGLYFYIVKIQIRY